MAGAQIQCRCRQRCRRPQAPEYRESSDSSRPASPVGHDRRWSIPPGDRGAVAIPRSSVGCPSTPRRRGGSSWPAACAAHVGLGPATLVLYDCSTLYFEIDEGDGFREPGFSKERRLEPQITVGLLTDVRGFPLQVHAFDGNTAETKTIIPVLTGFAAAYGLPGVTVVADAGMMSEANCKELEDAGLTFIVGARIPDVPYQVREWQRRHLGPADRRPAGLRSADDHGHQGRPAAADDHLPVPGRPGPPHPEGHRHPDRESGEGRHGRPGRGEAEPVRPADRRHPAGEQGPRGRRPEDWPG